MPSVGPLRPKSPSNAAPGRVWRIISIVAAVVSVVLSVVVFGAKLQQLEVLEVVLGGDQGPRGLAMFAFQM
jgi:hypothetical protein